MLAHENGRAGLAGGALARNTRHGAMRTTEYLYDQKGPWPQPNPLDDRLFRIVLHLPLRERVQWYLRVGLRYAGQAVLYTPLALLYALRNPNVRVLSDHEFEERFDNTVFNKMVVPFRMTEAMLDALEADGVDVVAPPAPAPSEPLRPERGSALDYADAPTAQMPIEQTQALILDRSEKMAAQMAYERFPEFMPHRGDASGDAEPAAKLPAEPAASECRYFIADFSIFDVMETFPGTYVAGTSALFKREAANARLDVIAIRINGMNLTPACGDAWELAKTFTMQAASIRLIFSTHALLHFPVDSINAITKERLPTNHVLFQLLYPHTDLQLYLDTVVQTGRTSPVLNNQIYPWCAHTGPSEGLIRSLVQLYLGVEGNPAYPAYTYKHPRRTPEEKYVNFLEDYYQTILRFVRKVLAHVEDGDPLVVAWADYVADYVPGFPNGDNIFRTELANGVRNLDWAVATFIWDVSVGHTTDHYNMGLLDINANPMRLRVPPPETKTDTFDRDALCRWTDIFRYRLFWRMFLTSTTVYRLADVRYPFTDPALRRCNDEFLADLKATAAKHAGEEFIPLREIARSVQF